MATSLFHEVRTRHLAKALGTALDGAYTAKPLVRTATVVSQGTVAVSGQHYDFQAPQGMTLPAGAMLNVANIQRPGAALYAPTEGGAVVVTSSGGGIISTPPGTSMSVHDILSAWHTVQGNIGQVVGLMANNKLGLLNLADWLKLFLGDEINGHVGLKTHYNDATGIAEYAFELVTLEGRCPVSIGLLSDGSLAWVRLGEAGKPGIRWDPTTGGMIVDPETHVHPGGSGIRMRAGSLGLVGVQEIDVPTGTMTDNGDGSVTLDYGAGSGSPNLDGGQADTNYGGIAGLNGGGA
jgi:hypothetical protein